MGDGVRSHKVLDRRTTYMTARDHVITPGSPRYAPTARPTLDDVIATDLLYVRPSRPADFKLENQALTALIEVMSQAPDVVLQKLADTALSLCNAGSAGISIAESDGPEGVFRWHATAGLYTQYLGGTMPRHFSPCGAVLDRDAPLLMINMVKYYDYVSVLNAPPYEVLLVPFYSGGEAIGTLWVVAHDGMRQFDREDLRILQSLTNFAAMAVKAFARTHELERANVAARDAGELREHFIAVLGHDLRNPLGAIANSAAILERGAPAERLQSIGHIVGQSARRIGELIDNLLDFTRGRLGGGIQINRTRLQTLEPALNDVVTELRTAYPHRPDGVESSGQRPHPRRPRKAHQGRRQLRCRHAGHIGRQWRPAHPSRGHVQAVQAVRTRNQEWRSRRVGAGALYLLRNRQGTWR
jgi:signal transduction histidine kinase